MIRRFVLLKTLKDHPKKRAYCAKARDVDTGETFMVYDAMREFTGRKYIDRGYSYAGQVIRMTCPRIPRQGDLHGGCENEPVYAL